MSKVYEYYKSRNEVHGEFGKRGLRFRVSLSESGIHGLSSDKEGDNARILQRR